MNKQAKTDYQPLFIGILILILLGMAWSLIRYFASPQVKYGLFAILVFAGIAVQVYIYKGGGFFPKLGKTSIYSKIIYGSIIFLVITLIVLLITYRLAFL